MLFTDAVVLVGVNFEEMNYRPEEWREVFEKKWLRISIDKTEYIDYDFGERKQRVYKAKQFIKLRRDVVSEVKRFNYL